MSDVLDPRSRASDPRLTLGRQRLSVIDCDIHPQVADKDEIIQFMPERWRDYARTFGGLYRQALADTLSHPRMAPEVSRNDAWPPKGSPGSDLQFMRDQHLDPNNIDYGMLMPLNRGPANQRNLDFGAAMCNAVNQWQIEYWLEREPRLRGSIVIAHDDAPAAIKEIELRAKDKRFVQIMMPPHSLEPLGRRKYWPVYEAAQAHGLPIALHVSGINGYASTGSGSPSYYIEEHHTNVRGMQGLITSLVLEGVFEKFPGMRFVLVEGGLAWAPALKWRLDKHFLRFRSEVPHLQRMPSEYVRDHIWFTTQPLDEPDRDSDLAEVLQMIGCDRVMFSTDYPHWDFDDPRFVLGKLALSDADKGLIFAGNARKLYGLP